MYFLKNKDIFTKASELLLINYLFYRYCYIIKAIFAKSNIIGWDAADRNYLPAERMRQQMKAIEERTRTK